MLQVKKVAVVSTDKHEDEAGASYTVYVLAVTGADGQQWGSARRGPCAAIPHWQCGLGIWDSHMNENGVRKDDGAVLGIRCVWSFRGCSPGKDWRFPVKFSKDGPENSKHIVGSAKRFSDFEALRGNCPGPPGAFTWPQRSPHSYSTFYGAFFL